MVEPEIIGSSRSTYTRFVRMVCEEKGIDYTLTEVPLGAPELVVHPFGKMPVLRHGELTLFESKAIATYLDGAFPAPFVLPSEPRMLALTEQWVSLVNTQIDRTIIRTYLYAYIAPGTPDGTPNRAAIEAVMPALHQQVALLDRAVADGHLVGDAFTLADINLMPVLHRLKIPPEGAAALAAARNLSAYYERHAQRPSFVRTAGGAGEPRGLNDRAQHYHFRPGSDGLRAWDIHPLIELARSFPVIGAPRAAIRLMDGMRRVARALLDNLDSLPGKRFSQDPAPDYVGVTPDDLPY